MQDAENGPVTGRVAQIVTRAVNDLPIQTLMHQTDARDYTLSPVFWNTTAKRVRSLRE